MFYTASARGAPTSSLRQTRFPSSSLHGLTIDRVHTCPWIYLLPVLWSPSISLSLHFLSRAPAWTMAYSWESISLWSLHFIDPWRLEATRTATKKKQQQKKKNNTLLLFLAGNPCSFDESPSNSLADFRCHWTVSFLLKLRTGVTNNWIFYESIGVRR